MAARGRWVLGLDLETALVVLISALFTLPVWIPTNPPMTDYPEHLAIASILRWYHDPARHLVENYSLVFDRPNVAFVYLVAGLSLVVSIGIAGKLVMAVSVALTGLAGLTLARRAGRPGWYGLFALLSSYNYGFFFGFVNNVIATPIFVYGLVFTDRLLDRTMGWRSWLGLCLIGCLLYFVHMQFLFLFICAVGWLALSRFSTWRNTLVTCSALLLGLALGLYHHLTSHSAGSFRYEEQQMFEFVPEPTLLFDKLVGIPGFLFGDRPDGSHWVIFLFSLVAALQLFRVRANRQNPERSSQETDAVPRRLWARVRAQLQPNRFVTLAGWFLLSYLALPSVFVGLYVYQRMIAIACLMLPAILPLPALPWSRLAKGWLTAALAAHLLFTSELAYGFHLETRDGHALIERAEPGKSIMALMLTRRGSVMDDPPLLLHFGTNYVAAKGGRVHKSFTENYISAAQLRRGLEFEDLHTQVNDWIPWSFRFERFGYHFDYVLIHGSPMYFPSIFAGHFQRMEWDVLGEWWLLRRKPRAAQ